MQCEQMEHNLNQFERLARKVQSRPEEEQRDICLIMGILLVVPLKTQQK